jgi:hypothetical protein
MSKARTEQHLSAQERAYLARRARANAAGWAERLRQFGKNPPLFFWWMCW